MQGFNNSNRKRNCLFNSQAGISFIEIIVILAVIAVVVIILIPNILNSTGDIELIATLKKKYPEISQTLKMIVYEQGGSLYPIGRAGTTYEEPSAEPLVGLYAKYFKHSLICTGENGNSCWHKKWKTLTGQENLGYLSYSYNGIKWETTPGSSFNPANYSGMILSDGTLLLQLPLQKCSTNDYIADYGCSSLYVDINGFKPPNTQGRDIFRFYILNDHLIPDGENSSYNCINPTPHDYNDGLQCTARSVRE